MSRSSFGKRKKGPLDEYESRKTHIPEEGALILSGDAAQVNYDQQTPVWKQEVTDERGRKRLHGAFTGGFSAGYFNTVGSKGGWQPSTFVSSRNSRYQGNEQKALDYMDEEDLEEIEDDRQLRIRSDAIAKKQAEEEDVEDAQRQDKQIQTNAAISVSVNGTSEKKSDTKISNIVPVRATPKISSLLAQDEEVDGFDIGPQIKYDKILAKKKKSNAIAQHKFQAKKIVRNPEPEAELYQRPNSPISAKPKDDIATEVTRLLPSIGEQESNAILFSDNNPTNAIEERVKETPVPPWRRPEQNPSLDIPSVGSKTAQLALQSTFTPYTNDLEKNARYRRYLEIEAGVIEEPHRQGDLEPDVWIAECEEFKKCALMYKPMTGTMSSKFTSSTAGSQFSEDGSNVWKSKVSSQVQAAKEGRFGHLTRDVESWTPNPLLIKRFGVTAETTSSRRSQREAHELRGAEIARNALQELMGDGPHMI